MNYIYTILLGIMLALTNAAIVRFYGVDYKGIVISSVWIFLMVCCGGHYLFVRK